MIFKKAERKKARLRLALTGPSGSGKTLSALMIAKGLGGRIAVLDTERDSASLYAEPVTIAPGRVLETPGFDAMNLGAPYSPERYIEAIAAAAGAGYGILIIDSISHEWMGSGGCLELVDEIARSRYRGNSWSAWNDVTPRHRALLDAILQSQMHIIVTLRSKTETAQQESGGKKSVIKLGMKAEQRDGFEYEMTTVFDLTHDGHFATATKDRTGLFMGRDPMVPGEATGVQLLAWLNSGAEAVPETPPPVTTIAPAVSVGREFMPREEVDGHVTAIRAAPTMTALKSVYGKAFIAANADDDAHAMGIFASAKDARKAAIEAAGFQGETIDEETGEIIDDSGEI